MFDATFQPQLGGLQAAQAISQAVDEYRRNQSIDGMNDTLMRHAVALGPQKGGISLQDYNDWTTKPQKERQGIANGVQANLLDTMKRSQATAQQQFQNAETQNQLSEVQQRTANANFRPNSYQITGPEPGAKPTTVWQMQRGGTWQTTDQLGGSGNDNSPYAQTAIWADDGTGKQIQVGFWDSKGTPHYFPGGRAGGAAASPFTPTPDTVKTMTDAGFTYAATSNKSGRWINTKGFADLDTNGNPIYSNDGTMVQSGGKMRPVTQAMLDAQLMPHPTATPTPSLSPTPPPTATATPAPNPIPSPQTGGTGTSAQPNASAAFAAARAAIAKGASPAAVAQRLQQMNIDPSGL
ncbi:MAG: hypothetical protein M3160_10100 [Candidatus Eremiobacteraeota bacterium]|nr:hypothetical protein [Candidatus Eremiobacteraeota bacterium]